MGQRLVNQLGDSLHLGFSHPPRGHCRRAEPNPARLRRRKRVEGENSWTVPVEEIIERGYDLSAKNPNRRDDYEHRPALELVQSIKAKEERIMDLLGELEGILEGRL